MHTAHACFLCALEIAAEIRVVPLIFDVLRGVPELLLASGERALAVELLAFITHHRSAPDETKTNAETLLAGTTKWYTSQIYGKLGVRNRSQAVLRARELGVVL